VHRDVKPANVMLTGSGAKVVDFGIAAVAGEAGESGPDGVVLGTPAYLAPERLAGGPVRPATDVYGLGLVIYRALTGGLPWAAETTTQLINAHVYAEPRPLPTIAGLPHGVADVCVRCLAKNPADRPTSYEVARALAAAAGIRVPLPAGKDDTDDFALDPAYVAHGPLAGRPPGRLRLAVAALFGPGVDAGAETSILPAWVIDSAVIRNARRLRRRRAVQVVGATAGLATAGLMLTTCADLPSGRGTPLAIAGQTAASRAPCAVRYVTRSDDASHFNVDVSVTNTSPQPLGSWTLRFAFTGDQGLREGSAGVWSQSPSGEVTVRPPASQASLPTGATRTLSFSAQYHDFNPMPAKFMLNAAECSYVLVGASGETRTGGPPPATGDGSGAEAIGDGAVSGGGNGGLGAGGGATAAPVIGPPADGGTTIPAATAGGGAPGVASPPPTSGWSPAPAGGGPSPSASSAAPSPSESTTTASPSPTPEPSPFSQPASPEPSSSS
jgi:serine/threonine-protein kinase